MRLFYRAFAGELNVGYRELMTLGELVERIEGGGRRHREPARPAGAQHRGVSERLVPG